MPARTRKKMSVSILIPFLVVILFFSIMAWKKYRASRELPSLPTQQQSEGGRSVTLFFAAEGTKLGRESREIDSVATYYIKTIHNGKIELVATISPEEALNYVRIANPPLPPGVTPGPPPGP